MADIPAPRTQDQVYLAAILDELRVLHQLLVQGVQPAAETNTAPEAQLLPPTTKRLGKAR